MENIPIHNFLVDDESSIPFQLIRLSKEGSYDTSVPHRHNYYEVFIFEVGGGNHLIDFSSFPIQSRSIHFVSPGQVHCVSRNECSKGFVLLFSRDFYSNNHKALTQFPFLNNNSSRPILNLNQNEFKALLELIFTIRAEQDSTEIMAKELIKLHLSSFLIYCKRYFNDKEGINTVFNDSLSFRFKQAVEENYLKMQNVSDFAAELNVSEKQLATATKKDYGKTPKELIHERLILEAKRLVLHTSYSFQEIAFFLNFTDASHFAKFFKSKTACSPGQYREKEEKYP
ncbi:MAG: helix-turn-helix transcriptional regulator [Vicingaceae bacterium]